MRTLWLLRHARAGSGGRDQRDHDRPLTERGLADAERLGRVLAAAGDFAPALTLCSTARRAEQTLARLERGLGVGLDAEFDRDLYLAGTGELEARIRHVPDGVASLLLVGHNPGLAELAVGLARRGDADAQAALRSVLPPCGLAELRFESPRWRELSDGAELVSYRTP